MELGGRVVAWVLGGLLLLVWVYIAARLGAWGVLRSLLEFKKKAAKQEEDDEG